MREAVAMAIDKEQLVERILRGYGTPGTTMVVPDRAVLALGAGAMRRCRR